ncbi:MAG: glycerophosphodiester phosphodiesterase family protein, partial [Bacteroidota bacterium]
MFSIINPPTPSAQSLRERQFEWHGHRGARGLFPENTIPSMTGAIAYGLQWLEIDIVVSKDRQIIVSHDPYFHPAFCSDPTGKPITKANKKQYNLFELTADEIRQFDCGLRQNKAYPQQQVTAAHKPTLPEMVRAVDRFCQKNNYPLPHWNIEIKSDPAGYGHWTVSPSE